MATTLARMLEKHLPGKHDQPRRGAWLDFRLKALRCAALAKAYNPKQTITRRGVVKNDV